jgi:hypothetical protein
VSRAVRARRRDEEFSNERSRCSLCCVQRRLYCIIHIRSKVSSMANESPELEANTSSQPMDLMFSVPPSSELDYSVCSGDFWQHTASASAWQ